MHNPGQSPDESAKPSSQHQLTNREIDVLKRIALGEATKEIAQKLFIAPKTAESHVLRIKRKLGIRDRVLLCRFAVRTGLLERDDLLAGRRITATLSDVQERVVRLLCEGLSMQEIANRMGNSRKAVESHLYRIKKKLKLHNRVQLAAYAISTGMIEP